MTHRLIAFLVIASLTFLAPRPAAAAITHTFDTVDAVEIISPSSNDANAIIVTGIRTGQTTATTVTFLFGNAVDHARQCERFALIAMAKPGKYRFAIGVHTGGSYYGSGCKLIRVNP